MSNKEKNVDEGHEIKKGPMISRRDAIRGGAVAAAGLFGVFGFYYAATHLVPQTHMGVDDPKFQEGFDDGTTFPIANDTQLVNRKLPQPSQNSPSSQNPNPTEVPKPTVTPQPEPTKTPVPNPTQPPRRSTPTPGPKPNPTPTPTEAPKKVPTKEPTKNYPDPRKNPEFNDNTQNLLYDEDNLEDEFGKYFSQRSHLYGREKLGNSKGTTMLSAGCLAACVAMVWSHVAKKDGRPDYKTFTPDVVNKHKNWFGQNSPGMIDPLPTLNGHKPTELGNTTFNRLHDLSDQGYAVILELKWVNSNGEDVYHYVVATRTYGQGENRHFLINDPWFGACMGQEYGNYWGDDNFTHRAWVYK